MIVGIVIGAALLLGPVPALLAWALLFGRKKERTVASSRLEGTYYAPYLEEMLAAEARLGADPDLRRVETLSEDGVRLCADVLPGEGRRAVVLVHGFMTAPTKNFGLMAETYRRAGFTVVMAHLRAHGPSGGRHNALGAAEVRDVLAWVRWCGENLPGQAVVLHGASMGGTAVGCSAGSLKGTPVRALVMDSAFSSPWIQLRQQARRWHIPHLLVLPCLNLIVRAFTGADLRTDVRDAMRATQIPCLFIHGTADSTVFFAQGQANFDSCAAEKQLLPVEGAEHTVALMMGGEALRRRVAAFAAEKCGEAEG